jgi:hypothetical protein
VSLLQEEKYRTASKHRQIVSVRRRRKIRHPSLEARPTKRRDGQIECGWGDYHRQRMTSFIDHLLPVSNLIRVCRIGRGVIACFCVDTKGRESLRGSQFDFDFTPPGVLFFVARVIPQNILVA